MIELPFAEICLRSVKLQSIMGALTCAIAQSGPNQTVPLPERSKCATAVQDVVDVCASLGVPNAISIGSDMVRRLNDEEIQWNNGMLHNAIKTFRDQIIREACKHKWARIDEKYADHLDNPFPWGTTVHRTFAAAGEDIISSRYALAVDLPTACIFHLMRAAEHGLKWLALRLKVKLIENRKPLPIDDAMWNKIIDGLNSRIRRTRMLVKSAKRRALLEMYATAAQHCDYMKDIWRNNVSHAHKAYSMLEAEAAADRVRDFMQSLGEIVEFELASKRVKN